MASNNQDGPLDLISDVLTNDDVGIPDTDLELQM
jgi:hypothetical protein